ncbi:MAG TPA: S9 family peptidase [Saprospiraceae bacterium]|nr:S9 family peptidase [Saprospiraceae bacterium]
MNILKQFILISIILLPGFVQSQKPIVAKSVETQNVMSPELMWQLGRVSPIGLSKDGKSVIYRVSTPNMDENKFSSKVYSVSINGGTSSEISDYESSVNNKNISPDGKFILSDKSIKIDNVHGFDRYPDLKLSTAQVYTSLDYRHWDTWNDGHFNHVFMMTTNASKDDNGVDIMKDEPFNCPTKPFGGDEDYIWNPDGNSVVYVSKKLSGTQAAQSTNTDLYQYNIKTGKTENLTESNKGYDTNPSYSQNGDLAYLSMKTDGYEADKNDIKVISKGIISNLTAQWDGTINSFIWADDNRNIFFTAPINGTIQLFKVDFPGLTKKLPVVEQLTDGEWDITGIVGQNGNKLVLTRTSMNRAADLYTYDIETKSWSQLTDVNKTIYDKIAKSRTEKRYVTTTDGKKMLVWVVYPPNFDPTKKYPALLYCQGGPQSALTQFYSFRWNLQLMASQGYIVVAPNRRGMPGHGVEWNHQISKDWGGQNIKDYLSAIDDVSKEAYVDKSRLGAVGASYGGYSVFYLAGIHEKRFKTFIAHDGVFNTKSMYGTTEEMFFVNYDFGGPYWEGNNKTYTDFNPINHVAKWDTPIYIIQGGKDYRVPIGQGLEAFNAAQLRGIKSKLLYLPDENHWVMKPQNSLVWQREFFQWLKETL